MQIDFHHTVIYVISRLAGFTVEQAFTINIKRTRKKLSISRLIFEETLNN